MSGRMWLNPQGNTGGTGGGEGGDSVNWRDIKGKPTSYTPSEHTHEKEEILGLVETLESLSSSEKEFLELLSEKVDKREGYDLSEENFTAELKKKLENIPSNVEIAVESVNGKTGAVVITKQDLELGNVINVRQASQEDLLSFQELTLSSFEATKKELANKVDIEQGKGLSTNDFTNEHKNKLEELSAVDGDYVKSVNGKKGEVILTKEEFGVDKVESALKEKVDKVTGKGLSSNDFTDELKRKVAESVIEGEVVTSVNNQKGDVTIDLTSLGLPADSAAKIKEIDNKVEKDGKKGLSTNDFTDAYRLKLDNITIGGGEGGGETPSGEYVSSINGYTGDVIIDKKDIGLENVKDVEQASKLEFNDFRAETTNALEKKVNKVEGKGLSEANFTNDEKEKLARIPEDIAKPIVTSVNNKIGDVIITKEDINLSNVLDIEQASKEEFEAHVNSDKHLSAEDREAISKVTNIKNELDSKVDKVEGKKLSSNDYTDDDKKKLSTAVDEAQLNKALETKVNVEKGKGLSANNFTDAYKNEIEKNSKGINLVGEALELHMGDLEKHLSDTDRANINNIGVLDGRITANELGIQEGIADLESHKENTNVHIDDVSRGNIGAVPNLIDRITAIEKSIGEGGNVPSDTVFEEIEKGKIYKLGDKIYDVVNGNLISGAMSYRFYKDNADSFLNNTSLSGQPRLVNNHFRIIPTGYYTQLARIFNDNEAFQGMLYNIIDLRTAGETQVTINSRETDPSTSDTTFTDNEITLEINPRHFSRNTRTPKPLKTGRISLNYYYELTANGLGSHYMIGHKITNNVINFIEYEEFDLNVRGKIVYDDSTIEEANNVSVVVRGELSNNIINVEGNTEYGEIIYNIDDGEIFIEEGEEDDKSFNYAGVVFAVSHNTFDKETARRFSGELTYSVDRMEHKHTPIFRNIDLKHYLNAVVDTMPKHNKENVLSQELKAQEDNPLGVANLKNIIVIDSDYDISQIPEGTIVFKKLGE